MLGPDAPISSLMRTDVHTVTPTHRLRDVREAPHAECRELIPRAGIRAQRVERIGDLGRGR